MQIKLEWLREVVRGLLRSNTITSGISEKNASPIETHMKYLAFAVATDEFVVDKIWGIFESLIQQNWRVTEY